MKFAVVTFGCRVNQADSLEVEEEFRRHGAEAASPEDADVVVVNSCSVTASADQGTRQTVRRLARTNPHARLIVTGCYATRAPETIRDLPNVVHVVPNGHKPQLVPLAFTGSSAASASWRDDGTGPCGAAIEPGVAGRTAYTLGVQTGCAEPCTYCIIPRTRGVPRSKPVSAVVHDAERVAAAGFKEIALTGVHLGSYGRDLTPSMRLVDLLRALAASRAAGAGVLFRLSSLEPMDCGSEIVDLVAAAGCFAPHFHLPLQHASDRVLAAMRRPYTSGQFAALVDAIRDRLPHASIGSDVIAGFPGETDPDFQVLEDYLGGSPLTHVHVFPYSDRPGTPASAMDGKVAAPLVRERARRLRAVSQRLSDCFRHGQSGSVHRALTLDDGTTAVTGNYLKVTIPPGHPRNTWVRVRVTESAGTLRGAVL
jgi:threonylcarbamoyladenosine tRNA methylthiotransferase MtaB